MRLRVYANEELRKTFGDVELRHIVKHVIARQNVVNALGDSKYLFAQVKLSENSYSQDRSLSVAITYKDGEKPLFEIIGLIEAIKLFYEE